MSAVRHIDEDNRDFLDAELVRDVGTEITADDDALALRRGIHE